MPTTNMNAKDYHDNLQYYINNSDFLKEEEKGKYLQACLDRVKYSAEGAGSYSDPDYCVYGAIQRFYQIKKLTSTTLDHILSFNDNEKGWDYAIAYYILHAAGGLPVSDEMADTLRQKVADSPPETSQLAFIAKLTRPRSPYTARFWLLTILTLGIYPLVKWLSALPLFQSKASADYRNKVIPQQMADYLYWTKHVQTCFLRNPHQEMSNKYIERVFAPGDRYLEIFFNDILEIDTPMVEFLTSGDTRELFEKFLALEILYLESEDLVDKSNQGVIFTDINKAVREGKTALEASAAIVMAHRTKELGSTEGVVARLGGVQSEAAQALPQVATQLGQVTTAQPWCAPPPPPPPPPRVATDEPVSSCDFEF